MTLPVNTIICGSDTKERKQWFKGASFAHPAKMHLSLQIYLIEHYTKRGDWILDPMTGSGTVLVACALGRNVICVELEKKFIDMQKANWEKIKALGPMLGYKMGEAVILQGDARNLNDLLVDKCIFSPPYTNRMDGGTRGSDCGMRPYTDEPRDTWPTKRDQSNIGNLPYGEISTVITSPPYAEAQTGGGIAKKGYQGPKHSPTDLIGKRSYMPEQAGQTKGQISNIPYQADAVITSPPYEATVAKGQGGETPERLRGFIGESCFNSNRGYSKSDKNIGNLKSENYLSAMLQVYQQCHKVLKASGLMILVVKNFIRNKKIVQLDLDTIKLCEQAGFVLKERLQRKLTQQSFWRIIYQQKYPDVPKIEFEDILIFGKS